MTVSNVHSPSCANTPSFICPICRSPIVITSKTWQCDGSLNRKRTCHPFDVARQGYVNLLPVQQKKSKTPGDSQASIEARQRFLRQGHYQPLQQRLQQIINELTKQDGEARWLDVGCGDGYYSAVMAQSKQIQQLIAIDISKPAVISLARQAKLSCQLWSQPHRDAAAARIYPIVASAAQLPLADASLEGMSSIFSPILPEIFARVLKPQGWLLIAKPDVGHLDTVRAALFDSVREHDSDKFLTQLAPFFQLRQTHRVECQLPLDVTALSDLLTMTPYAYRAQPHKRQALLAATKKAAFSTHARFVVYLLQKGEVQPK